MRAYRLYVAGGVAVNSPPGGTAGHPRGDGLHFDGLRRGRGFVAIIRSIVRVFDGMDEGFRGLLLGGLAWGAVLLGPAAAAADPVPPLRRISEPPTAREAPPDTLDVNPEPVNRVLAVVGDRAVTLREYRRQYGDVPVTRRRLDDLVNRHLLREAARDRDLMPDTGLMDRYVNRRMSEVRSRAGARFEAYLRRESRSETQFRQRVRRSVERQIIISRLVEEFFPDEGSDTVPAGVKVRARMIVVEDVATAWHLYRWLREDPRTSTWNRLFERYSQRMSPMGQHGDLGWFQWGHFHPKIEYRVFRLPLHGVSRPFSLKGRYAIVSPTGMRVMPDGATVSPGVLKAYRRYRQRFYREKLSSRLRDHYTVEIPPSVRRSFDGEPPERG